MSFAFTHSETCITDVAASQTDKYTLNEKEKNTKSAIECNSHVAKYKGQLVYVKRLKAQKIKVDRKLLKEMKTVSTII